MKNKKYLTIIGLVIIAFCIFGVILFLSTKKAPKENESLESFVSVPVTDDAVIELYSNISVSDSLSFNRDIYDNGTITNNYMLGLAMAKLQNESNTSSVKGEYLLLNLRKIFGVTSINNEDFSLGSTHFSYDEITDTYSITAMTDFTDEQVLRKLVAAKKNTTEYILTEKIVVVTPQEPKQIYNDIYHTKLLGEETDPKIDSYLNEASTYDYHFTFNGETFVLTSITK